MPGDAEIQKAIDIIKSDAQLAHQAAMIERLDRLEEKLKRMPVTEMTAEEKAAEYDKLMAQKTPPPKADPPEPGKTGPVPPPVKTDPPVPPKKDWFYGDRLNS
jgi:hypothetical protein